MRVLVISNLYPPISRGGYEACCEMVVEHLRGAHDVLVLTSDEQARAAPGQPWVQRTLPRFSQVSGDTLGAPFRTARAMRRTQAALAAFRPDVLFVWNGSGLPVGALRMLELSGIPLVYAVHDPWLGHLVRADPFARYLQGDQRGLRRAYGVIVRLVNRLPGLRVSLDGGRPVAITWNSDALRRLVEVPPQLDPVIQRTIHPATPLQPRLTGLIRRPGGDGTLLFAGRVESVKGPDIAYRALAALRDRHGLRCRLVLAGEVDPRFRPVLDGLAGTLGLGDQVELTGPLAPGRLTELYAVADVLVIPSRWQEPFGLVGLEGAMAQIPIVAARSGGLRELLAEEEHALFFDIDDADGAADALARVLGDPDETAERVRQAHRRAMQFSIDAYVRANESLLVEAQAALARRR